MLKRLAAQKSALRNPHPGVYHYRRQAADENSRIHLRLDPDGHGTLIINANRIMHLNPTAALMTYLTLEKATEAQAIQTIRKQYQVSRKQAVADLHEISDQLEQLVRPDGACPMHDLGLETVLPFSARPTAPVPPGPGPDLPL